MNKLIYLFFLLVVVSCKKEEIPVAKHIPGESVVNSFDMGNDYRRQAFFDLKTNTFVSQNLRTTWDLGFESGESGNHIVLNSANGMKLGRVSNAAFNSVNDTVGLEWRWDVSSGDLDSTAIGDWQVDNFVYVIDRGDSFLGVHRGFYKLKMNNVSTTTYSFKVANLDGSLEEQVSVLKDENVNFTSFSLESKAIVQVDPPKAAWDLKFSMYVSYFDYYLGEYNVNYLVNGVLINRSEVAVAEIFDKDFESITSDDLQGLDFSSKIDAIGFDWKEFIFTEGNYIVFPSKNYIVKSTEGIYYKLHFIDFYNVQGDKGSPVFEFQEL